MPKDTFYFSHDYNARNDEKIKRLIRKHGMQGYGVFWSIVEDLYNNANALRMDYEGIAYDLRSDSELVASVVNDFDLFIFNGDYFGSNSVQERLEQRNDKSAKARKSASYRWENANAMQTQSDSNAKKERKGKEIKGKEIKGKEIKEINISFDIFWDLYDKKVGDKEKLKKKWDSMKDDDRSLIIEYIPKYKLIQPEKKFRKDPQTFFNNSSWNDELIGSSDIPKTQIYKNGDFEAYKKRQQELGKTLN
jgi:hypothetical protein